MTGIPARPIFLIIVLRFSNWIPLAETVQQNVVPMRRIEVLDGCQFEPRRINFTTKCCQFRIRPKVVRVTGISPPVFVSDRLIGPSICIRLGEIVYQMNNHVRAAALPGELVILRIELVPVKSKT